MQFAEIPSSGGYFKAAEHVDDVALLIEVIRFAHQVPSNFGPKDTAYADVSVFATQAALDAGTPDEQKNIAIQGTALAKDLEQLVGQATIVKLGQSNAKVGQKPAWIWKPVESATKQKVIDYATKREADVEEAAANAPGFE